MDATEINVIMNFEECSEGTVSSQRALQSTQVDGTVCHVHAHHQSLRRAHRDCTVDGTCSRTRERYKQGASECTSSLVAKTHFTRQ